MTPRKPKLSAVIAEAIEEEVVSAGLGIGALVATEGELVARFGVSRATIREAVGLVERRGTAAMRPGKKGGLVVSGHGHDAAVRALSTYMELADAKIEDLFDVRLRFELLATEKAAERLTADDITTLRALVARLEAPTGDPQADAQTRDDIRHAIAKATRNPALVLFVDALNISTSDIAFSQVQAAAVVRETIERSAVVKRQLVEAIIGCDRYAAQELAREDVAMQRQAFRETEIATLGQAERASGRQLKLPRLVALRISHDIAERGLVSGDRLAAEPELLETYGVSRSVLREALRTLEAYSVVRMRRGQGGGLYVSTPDPQPTIATVVKFLKSSGIGWSDLFELREPLEMEAARLAVRRVTPRQLAELCAAIEGERTARDAENWMVPLTAVPRLLAACSGNHVLELMIRCIIAILTENYVAPDKMMIGTVIESHERIVDALGSGDESLALRGIHDHLTLVARERRSLLPDG